MTNVSSSSSVWRSWVATSGSMTRRSRATASSVIYQMCLAIFPDWRTLQKYITCLHTPITPFLLGISRKCEVLNPPSFCAFRPSYIFEWIWLPPVGNICCLGWVKSQCRSTGFETSWSKRKVWVPPCTVDSRAMGMKTFRLLGMKTFFQDLCSRCLLMVSRQLVRP